MDTVVNHPTLDDMVYRTRRGILLVLVLFVVLMASSLVAGRFVVPDAGSVQCWAGAQTITEYNVDCAVQNAGESLLRMGMVIVSTIVTFFITKKVMGFATDDELVNDLHSPNNNDSPVFILCGAILMAAWIVTRVPFTGILPFIVNALFRYSLAAFMFIPVQIALLYWRGKIRSLAQFVKVMNTPGTNSVAIITATSMIVSALLVTPA